MRSPYKTECFSSELPGSGEEGTREVMLQCEPEAFPQPALFASVGVQLGGATLTMLRSFCLQLMSLLWILLAHHQLAQGESLGPALLCPPFQIRSGMDKTPQLIVQNRAGLTWKTRECFFIIQHLGGD